MRDVSVDAWNVQESVDFTKYNGVRPTYKVMDKFGSWLLNPDMHMWEYQYLQMHDIEAMDNFFLIEKPSYEGSFFTLGKNINNPIHNEAIPGFLTISIYLQQESVLHVREVFNMIDLIGELGGVIEVFIMLFGFFLFPVAQFSFVIKATKMMFLART